MCRALERRGWHLDRIRGAHHVYKAPAGGRIVIVPVHGNKSLPTGTQRGIMKAAGLTEDDL
jgi:predicted RNA binding protein YcfA (HicA-like mRNA interferase family)